jgi:hypothetical protein
MKTFNARKLYEHMDAIRQHRGLRWADVSRDTGVPTKTITGLENDSKPNADNLSALIFWSKLKFETYIAESTDQQPVLALSFERQDEIEDAE